MTNQPDWLKITRTFDAPVETIWALWTDPEMFRQWYGPQGMSVPEAEMDLTLGGTRRICMEMSAPDRTMRMYFTGVYKEITAPTRLVYTESMCDEHGTILSPQDMGMPADHPDITEVIVDLSDEGGKTVMTMVHRGLPEGSAAGGGWNQAFDKLADLLAVSA